MFSRSHAVGPRWLPALSSSGAVRFARTQGWRFRLADLSFGLWLFFGCFFAKTTAFFMRARDRFAAARWLVGKGHGGCRGCCCYWEEAQWFLLVCFRLECRLKDSRILEFQNSPCQLHSSNSGLWNEWFYEFFLLLFELYFKHNSFLFLLMNSWIFFVILPHSNAPKKTQNMWFCEVCLKINN